MAATQDVAMKKWPLCSKPLTERVGYLHGMAFHKNH
jgi:hypothetical protein